MEHMNFWEYGIAIGVLALVIPLLVWIVRVLIRNNVDTDLQHHNEIKDLILRLHNSDSDDRKDLTAEISKLNTNLAELTGMITFLFKNKVGE